MKELAKMHKDKMCLSLSNYYFRYITFCIKAILKVVSYLGLFGVFFQAQKGPGKSVSPKLRITIWRPIEIALASQSQPEHYTLSAKGAGSHTGRRRWASAGGERRLLHHRAS